MGGGCLWIGGGLGLGEFGSELPKQFTIKC